MILTVRKWRDRFSKNGVAGLRDSARPGRPHKLDPQQLRQRVLATLEQPPPDGQASWDGPAVAAHLGVNVHAVWRLLRKEGICLQRRRSWCVSTDPEFAAKAADIIGLYLNPPLNAMVLSVDEKPSIQAKTCPAGFVKTGSGKIVRGFKSTLQAQWHLKSVRGSGGGHRPSACQNHGNQAAGRLSRVSRRGDCRSAH